MGGRRWPVLYPYFTTFGVILCILWNGEIALLSASGDGVERRSEVAGSATKS